MERRKEGIFALVAALLVLATNVLEPQVSAALAVGLLILFALYEFLRKPKP